MEANNRVLIVDDEEIIREAFQDILIEEDYNVDIAGSAAEATTLFNTNTYDVVYIDIILPIKSGIELAREFRSIDNSVSIVMFTGKIGLNSPDNFKSLHIEIFDFLTKPVPTKKLLDTTKRAIEMKKKRICVDKKIGLIDESDDLQTNVFNRQEKLDRLILEGKSNSTSISEMVADLAAQRQEARARLFIINSTIKQSLDQI
jgi:DNA-binding NtrC family response regulator